MKTLVYISSCGLDSQGRPGSFFLQELPWLLAHFDRVVLCSHEGVAEVTQPNPERISAKKPLWGRITAVLRTPLQAAFWQELAHMRHDRRLNAVNAVKLYLFAVRGLTLQSWTEGMIRIIRYEGQPVDTMLNRASTPQKDVTDAVAGILADVRTRGDEAALEYCERFDGARPQSLLVTAEEIDRAFAAVEPELIATMELAAANIARFHAQQKRAGFMDAQENGVVVGQRVLPLTSVGLYVPGGTARYPSSVLMDAIPAKIAGVRTIVMTTPPDAQGNVPDVILAAAKIAGVSTIVKLGGAQAIAALAYGTKSVPRVDKIVGPGNVYVATAKQLCFAQGLIDIDMVCTSIRWKKETPALTGPAPKTGRTPTRLSAPRRTEIWGGYA